jgi:cellulose synthase/poly-beta-1,6-N-acetylglucosamine synthase-like glycosyltransferase
MVSREAYEATGGYESMPFSITEDYALLHNTFRRGFGFRNVLDASVLAESLPIASVKELLQQRVRWMHGAMQLPKLLVTLLFIVAFFYPSLFFIAFSKPWMALGLFFLKIGMESMFAGMVMQQLKLGLSRKKKLFATLLLYEFYAAALSVSMIILYFLPMKVRWKGRIFQ